MGVATEAGALVQHFLNMFLLLLPLVLVTFKEICCLNLELLARVLFRKVKGHPLPLFLLLFRVDLKEQELQIISPSVFRHMAEVVPLHIEHLGFDPKGIFM